MLLKKLINRYKKFIKSEDDFYSKYYEKNDMEYYVEHPKKLEHKINKSLADSESDNLLK